VAAPNQQHLIRWARASSTPAPRIILSDFAVPGCDNIIPLSACLIVGLLHGIEVSAKRVNFGSALDEFRLTLRSPSLHGFTASQHCAVACARSIRQSWRRRKAAT
jgi:hypothetical protein